MRRILFLILILFIVNISAENINIPKLQCYHSIKDSVNYLEGRVLDKFGKPQIFTDVFFYEDSLKVITD
jgi:hypothetical protein